MNTTMTHFNSGKSVQWPRAAYLAVAAAILIAGCASNPPPTEQMATSRNAISSASSAGGTEFAPFQMNQAMQKMDAAERAINDKDFELARQLAEKAQVDAQLAAAMARSAKANKAAVALQEANRVLNLELDRKAP
jgi:hypothetical protein